MPPLRPPRTLLSLSSSHVKSGISSLATGFGADKTMTAVISGEADIGFMGAEASIYAYQEGATYCGA